MLLFMDEAVSLNVESNLKYETKGMSDIKYKIGCKGMDEIEAEGDP